MAVLFNWLIYTCSAGADSIPHVLVFIRQITHTPWSAEVEGASKLVVYLRHLVSNFTIYV